MYRIFTTIITCLFLAGLSLSNPAQAAVVDFSHFSIDIPVSWGYAEDSGMVTIAAMDNSSILVFSPDKLPEGQSLKEFSEAFSAANNGSIPDYDGSGTYQFDYKNDVGANAHVIISQADPKLNSIFMILIVGEEHIELPAILGSVKFKN